tara:strand:- start:112 stop:372 length:261 start_codon:yes stop_codon:yes gene_type:complete
MPARKPSVLCFVGANVIGRTYKVGDLVRLDPKLIKIHRAQGDWVPPEPVGVVMMIENVHDMYRITVLFGSLHQVYLSHELVLVSEA